MSRPNVVLVLADDLGFSDIGSYGGEIPTPHLDALAREGLRMTQFYSTPRCSPSRASLLTGRHPHETGVGILTADGRPLGYPGTMSSGFPTVAEMLSDEGYATCLAGKWHVSSDTSEPNDSWPTRRGFSSFYGILAGADDYFHPTGLLSGESPLPRPDDGYYLTDAISGFAADFVTSAASEKHPFFLYLAYTSPHWPLHAPEDMVAPHEHRYAAGWDTLREERFERMRAAGVVGSEAALSPRDPAQPRWDEVIDPEWEARRMAVYAAQVQIMDRGIGRVVDALKRHDVFDDTMILFLSDNGACAEDLPPWDAPDFRAGQPATTPSGAPIRLGNEPAIVPGSADTFSSYGKSWANLSNTPFRLYKRWVHEGGISTPLIVHWPGGALADGAIIDHPYQLTDVLPTILETIGAHGPPGPGTSMLDSWRGRPWHEHPLYWEHIGNAAVRDGRWKAVREADRPWELYDLERDRSELDDRAVDDPQRLDRLVAEWEAWASASGVIPWERIRGQRA